MGNDPQGIVEAKWLLELTGDWKSYLSEAQVYRIEEFERHERTGRPLGDESFLELAEKLLNRDLKRKRPGPKVNGK